MRIPDPKANTTTEAYLAYKAGYLEESELKPVLYEPYLHFDAWLAYWAGLTVTYPVKNVGKNLFDKNHANIIKGYFEGGGTVVAGASGRNRIIWLPCKENTTYTVKEQSVASIDQRAIATTEEKPKNGTPVSEASYGATRDVTFITPKGASFIVIRYQSALETNIETLMQDILDTLQIEEGSTASAYEPYTGEPEMLCDEEALVAYLSGVTNTYPEEIKDPYDVRIVRYLRHLASIRWPEPDYPVNNEEFYLSTMEPTHTSNPEPSSDIELDTAEGKIISVEAYGDTYQQTYSGDNLFDYKDGSQVNAEYTTDENGWISLTVTNSSSSTQYFNYYTHNLALSEDTSYTVVFEIKNVSYTGSPTLALVTYNSSQGQSKTNVTKSLSELSNGEVVVATFTTKPDFSVLTFDFGLRTYISVPADASCSVTFRISVLADTSVTPETFIYQPYTGGIPAPSPDYPQNVQAVTGEQTVEVHGKNLFPLGTGSYTDYGITSVYNSDGSITVSGTASATYADLTANRIVNYEQGKTYTTSITEALPISFGLITLGAGAREDISIAAGTKSGKRTFSYTHNIAKLYIYNLTVGQSYNFTIYPMVEEGSSASSFEPYQTPQSYPISLGSIELFKIGDYQDYIYKNGDDWYVHEVCKSMALSISSMDNDEDYPGWKNLTSLKADLGVVTPSTGNAGHIGAYCPYYTNIKGYVAKNSQATNVAYVSCNFNNNNAILYLQGSVYGLTQTQWKTQYPNLNLELYYVLATPTDTQITDETLIGQLEALAGADTYNEKTFIKVTATDPNLPALLKVEAYKY